MFAKVSQEVIETKNNMMLGWGKNEKVLGLLSGYFSVSVAQAFLSPLPLNNLPLTKDISEYVSRRHLLIISEHFHFRVTLVVMLIFAEK